MRNSTFILNKQAVIFVSSLSEKKLLSRSSSSSLVQSSLTLWLHGLHCSTTGFPVPQYVPEFAQTHVHGVSDAIQPSHPLLPPSFPAFNFSQHQGLFQWISSLHQVAKVLELQYQSFQWIFRTDFLYDWLVWSPCSPRDSRVFSSTIVRKHQFFYGQTLTWIHDYWKNFSFD